MTNAKKNKDVSGTKPEGTAAKDVANAPQEAKRRPVHYFHEGPIHVSVWPNDVETRDGTRRYYSFTIQRAYEDKSGVVKFTNSFQPQSLENLVKAVQKVSEYLQALTRADAPVKG